jgi:hypothetical protein
MTPRHSRWALACRTAPQQTGAQRSAAGFYLPPRKNPVAVPFDYRRFTAFPRNITGLPKWAQMLVVVAALPGVLLLAAAALIAVVGVFVIGLLALPTYRILRALAGRPIEVVGMSPVVPPTISISSPEADQPPGERRQVESRVVE